MQKWKRKKTKCACKLVIATVTRDSAKKPYGEERVSIDTNFGFLGKENVAVM